MSSFIDQNLLKKIKNGAVFVYPNDTVYSLGASVVNTKAIKKIFQVKGRGTEKAVSIALASLRQARQIAYFNKAALRLWQKFMPGALTLVLPLLPELKKQLNWRLLTGGSGKIGIRMPDHPWPLKLVKKLGTPITTTSANVSGRPSCYTVLEVMAQFGKRKIKPDIIIAGGKLKRGRISTVVDLSGPEVKILRAGSIPAGKILKFLND